MVEAADRILAELPASLARYATRQLELRGFEIHLNTTLTAVDGDGATISTGETIPAGTVVWTAGVRPNPLVADIGVGVDRTGRMDVDGHLRVRGRRDMRALGDAASVPNPATPWDGSTRRRASTRCGSRGGWRPTCWPHWTVSPSAPTGTG